MTISPRFLALVLHFGLHRHSIGWFDERGPAMALAFA
jgi:hypothetical protein